MNNGDGMYTHLDFFSGTGGICTGFKAAGIKTLLAVEKVKSCVDTYTKNHPETVVIHNDIRNVEARDLKRHIKNQNIDIITSGMPCETFSTAGSKSRSFYDHRQQLYYETIRLADNLKPKLILFENVIGITSKRVVKGEDRLVIEDIYDDLSEIGYKYQISVTLNASDFGIPQHRQRFFILATNNPKFKLRPPVGKHNGTISVEQAFAGLPIVQANENKIPPYTDEENEYTQLLKNKKFWRINNKVNGTPTYHIPPKHRATTIQRFQLIEQGENLKDLFDKFNDKEKLKLQENGILPKKWFIQRNMRLVPQKPSKTVTSHCLDELIHPYLDRGLTVREVARLQSFPDNYDFFGGPFITPHLFEEQDKYEQVGDAVPPLLAYHWGKELINILEGK